EECSRKSVCVKSDLARISDWKVYSRRGRPRAKKPVRNVMTHTNRRKQSCHRASLIELSVPGTSESWAITAGLPSGSASSLFTFTVCLFSSSIYCSSIASRTSFFSQMVLDFALKKYQGSDTNAQLPSETSVLQSPSNQ